jgi:hypothetical protein
MSQPGRRLGRWPGASHAARNRPQEATWWRRGRRDQGVLPPADGINQAGSLRFFDEPPLFFGEFNHRFLRVIVPSRPPSGQLLTLDDGIRGLITSRVLSAPWISLSKAASMAFAPGAPAHLCRITPLGSMM